eukprot:7816247-Ditylum_brightwellii.AAC.1
MRSYFLSSYAEGTYSKLQDITKLQICQQVTQRKDPRVIVGTRQAIAHDVVKREKGEGGNNNDEDMDIVDNAFRDITNEDLVLVGDNGVDPEDRVVEGVMNATTIMQQKSKQDELHSFMWIKDLLRVYDFKTNRDTQEKHL